VSLERILPFKVKTRPTKRLGRGNGSGTGKTAGRGHKGQHSRAGSKQHRFAEGGQLPLFRRIPKRGFNNTRFATCYEIVNVENLAIFDASSVVDVAALAGKGLVSKATSRVKLLGNGQISVPLTVKVHAVSKSAQAKVTEAGGTIELLA